MPTVRHIPDVFLTRFYAFNPIDFVVRGWREAIAEGLKEGYGDGGEELWDMIMNGCPNQFPPDYPSSTETLVAVLANFRTKRELEEAWTKMNAPNFKTKLLKQLALQLPTALAHIVLEYAATSATWLDIEE